MFSEGVHARPRVSSNELNVLIARFENGARACEFAHLSRNKRTSERERSGYEPRTKSAMVITIPMVTTTPRTNLRPK